MAESSSELQVQLWSDVSWVTAGGVTVTVAVVVVVKAVVVVERYEDRGKICSNRSKNIHIQHPSLTFNVKLFPGAFRVRCSTYFVLGTTLYILQPLVLLCQFHFWPSVHFAADVPRVATLFYHWVGIRGTLQSVTNWGRVWCDFNIPGFVWSKVCYRQQQVTHQTMCSAAFVIH